MPIIIIEETQSQRKRREMQKITDENRNRWK